MKKNFSLSILIVLFSGSLIAQIVPEVQRPLVTKIAATWCPPCGGWGWTFFENLVIDNEDKATLIVAHHSGDLICPSGAEFSENFNTPYQPYFYVYNDDLGVSSSNATSKRTAVKDLIDAESVKMPIVNAGMNLLLAGDELVVETKTKFFQDASGEYYLGVYAVENEVINNQSGQGNNAVHEKVLRGRISDEIFGDFISSGDVSANSEFDQAFSIILDNGWDLSHLEIITIVWEKEGDKFVAINTNLSTDFIITVGNENVLLENASMEILPNVTSNQAVVNIDLTKELKNATIELFDLDGKKVADIFQGRLSRGNSKFEIERNLVPVQGMYLVVLKSDQKVVTKKIIFN
jgi:hypothetical protein